MTATAKQFLAALASQVGYREGRDPDGNWNNDNKFGRWYGMNRVAWCAEFQSWGANEVGALGTIVPKFASCYAGLTWFRQRGQTGVWPPRPGDIGMLRTYNPTAWWADPDGWATAHVFAVERYVPIDADSGYNVTLEGNTNLGGSAQGNGVYRLQRHDTRTGKAIIYCRPKWAAEPPAPKPPAPSGGQSAPIHVPPKPAPKPAPVAPRPPILPTSQRWIDDEALRLGKRSEAARRFNTLLWAKLWAVDRAYCNANYKAWMGEASNLFGPQALKATQRLYAYLNRTNRAAWPDKYTVKPVPTYPGPALVKYVGGNPD